MMPFVPSDVLAGGLELVCYGCTVLAAFLSFLMLPR
jgi:hypothetical protein